MMRRVLGLSFTLLVVLLLPLGAQTPAPGSSPTDSQAPRQRIEHFLRYLYAWGPETEVRVGPLLESRLPGLLSVLVQVKRGEHELQDVLLVSAEGRYLVRGDLFDTTENPFAEALAQIRLLGAPSRGSSQAVVTIVEFGDFQCPDCRALAPVLKKVLQNYPSVRLVWKDLPLTQIHKWALAAHLSARCVYEQSEDAFWQVHDYLLENQAQLTPDNLAVRLETFLERLHIDHRIYAACRDQDSTRPGVDHSVAEAAALGVRETPTLFVNGRRLTGVGDSVGQLLEHIIQFELHLRQQGSAEP